MRSDQAVKTKHWVLLLSAVLVLCIGLSLWLWLPGQPAREAQIWVEGKLWKTVPLTQDQTFAVETQLGKNVITVQNGAIAVTEADCPGGDCMARGFCNSGAQIVCLPHRLVISFAKTGTQDSVTG